ncbi:MAG: TRAP transporter small permease subunit [Deltaproteobacteria bacterium]|nr:MAG: TRAP transporter small permease subunit [Deltaproteobacteria bacterium]
MSLIDRILASLMRGICIACIVFLLILMTGNVFFRFVPIISMGWYDEIVELLFAWLVFIGAAALWRENTHFRVEWFYAKFENRSAGYMIGLLIESLSLFFLVIMTFQGLRITLLANDWTPILKLPKRLQYVDIPIAGSLMILYSVRNIVYHILSLLDYRESKA